MHSIIKNMNATDELQKSAGSYFNSGNNCAQATALALAEKFGYKEAGKTFQQSFIPLGGGVGEESICGAVTGTLCAISFLLSQQSVKRELIIDLCGDFKEKFTNKSGSLRCRDLLEDFRDKEGNLKKDDPERKSKCTNIIHTAISNALEILDGRV
jgi:C_GCAxxG_C_C family probable redox protein